MRPSPGVTVLQYFLMSLAQAFSSFVILAVNFSRIVFPISVCADAGPADKTASKGNSPSLTSNFTVIFIERPLMTGSEPSLLRRNRRRVAMEAEGFFSLNPHCAKASVSFETPRERLTQPTPRQKAVARRSNAPFRRIKGWHQRPRQRQSRRSPPHMCRQALHASDLRWVQIRPTP